MHVAAAVPAVAMPTLTCRVFRAFTGSNLDGGSVSSDIFAENSVTVVNFWFSSCAPCVGELPELNALNEELMEKGGAVIGINTDTLGGGM